MNSQTPAPSPTVRLYLDDSHVLETDARVLAVREDALACDRSCFYPGGGGQPADTGWLQRVDDGVTWPVRSASVR